MPARWVTTRRSTKVIGERSSFWVRARRCVGALVVDNFFRGLSQLGRLHPNADPARHGVDVVRDLSYVEGGARLQRLDVYRPRGIEGRMPVVLYIHGGGFRIMTKEMHWVQALAFARAGYLVVNISYRLAPTHPYPSALEDCAAALAWVTENAARYGGDLGRLVIAGESAGANLALTTALLCCVERPEPFARDIFRLNVVPRAVLPLCGILQVSDVARFARRRPMPNLLLDRMEEVRESYIGGRAPGSHDLADPLLLLEEGPRIARPFPAVFSSVGTKDPLLDDTRRLHAALVRLGVDSEIRYYPGEMHAFQAMVFRHQARRFWQDAYDFLARRGLGPVRPLVQVDDMLSMARRPRATA